MDTYRSHPPNLGCVYLYTHMHCSPPPSLPIVHHLSLDGNSAHTEARQPIGSHTGPSAHWPLTPNQLGETVPCSEPKTACTRPSAHRPRMQTDRPRSSRWILKFIPFIYLPPRAVPTQCTLCKKPLLYSAAHTASPQPPSRLLGN